jgi:hypothetical protein
MSSGLLTSQTREVKASTMVGFTAVVVFVWIRLWIGIEVILFDDDMMGAVLTGRHPALLSHCFM